MKKKNKHNTNLQQYNKNIEQIQSKCDPREGGVQRVEARAGVQRRARERRAPY